MNGRCWAAGAAAWGSEGLTRLLGRGPGYCHNTSAARYHLLVDPGRSYNQPGVPPTCQVDPREAAPRAPASHWPLTHPSMKEAPGGLVATLPLPASALAF